MSDRLFGFTVFFDREIRDDDAEALRAAILLLKNVTSVRPLTSTLDTALAEQRATQRCAEELNGIAHRWICNKPGQDKSGNNT